jgi:RimJ/RimL family protein N-acetyltransferase
MENEPMIPRLATERLILREWSIADFDTLAQLYADGETMRFLGGVMDRDAAWRAMAGMIGQWTLRGYGVWAVERKSDGALVGRVGLIHPEGWPQVECGWTLARGHWGQGYASEAAEVAISYAFLTQPVERMISCIDPDNVGSQAVARRVGETKGERIGLKIAGKDFPVDIWSITRGEWQRRAAAG